MKVINYIKETWAEMQDVHWPSRKQVMNFTAIVIGISLFVAFFLGFFDYISAFLLKTFIL